MKPADQDPHCFSATQLIYIEDEDDLVKKHLKATQTDFAMLFILFHILPTCNNQTGHIMYRNSIPTFENSVFIPRLTLFSSYLSLSQSLPYFPSFYLYSEAYIIFLLRIIFNPSSPHFYVFIPKLSSYLCIYLHP